MSSGRQQNIFVRVFNDPAIRTALFMFILLRVVTACIGYWVVTYKPPQINYAAQPYIYNIYSEIFTTQGVFRPWIDPWYRWDTGWYLHIAYKGYFAGDGSIIFPPLYPFTIKLLAAIIGDYLLSGLIISNVCCFIMLVLLYKLVVNEFNSSVAKLTLLITITFPTAFYFVAAYSESLYMALLLGSWLSTMKRRYWLGGLLAFLAALTRSQGWVLALPLGYIAYIQHLGLPTSWRNYLRNPVPLISRLPVLIGGPLGTATYVLGMQAMGLGSVSAAYESPVWNVNVVMPWDSLSRAAQVIIQGTASLHDLANIGSFVFAAILAIVLTIKFKPPYWLYVWPTLAFILLRGHTEIQLHGMLRYTVDLFPIFIVLACMLQPKTASVRVVCTAYLMAGFALQTFLVVAFAGWLWVS